MLDITNDVNRELARSGVQAGLVYITPEGSEPTIVRVNERESGFFSDLEAMLDRIVPAGARDRARLLLALLGPRTEQVPFVDGRLCLGTWQRVLLFGFGDLRADWSLTILG